MDRAAPNAPNKVRGTQGHKTAGSRTEFHLGKIKWALYGWPFSLFKVVCPPPPVPSFLGAPRVQHGSVNFTEELRRGIWEQEVGPKRKGCPGRAHDQQEMEEGLAPGKKADPEGRAPRPGF